MSKNKKRRNFSYLFNNNKFLFILSILISLSIWIYFSLGSPNDTTVTLSNIPIQIELSDEAKDNGLQIFSGGDQTATVTVSGSRTVLGSINDSKVTVTAAANAINSSGTYSLSVSAEKTNTSDDFQITSALPSVVSVLVDYQRESTFDIQENVVYKVADGYYASTSLSSKQVVISGPQNEISKIAKVSAVASLDGTLTKSTSTQANIILYDSDNKKISTDLLTMDMKTVDANVSVMPEKTVKVEPVFNNKPSGLEITDDMIKIEPSSILIAGTKSMLDKTDTVELEPIDFSTLKNENTTFDQLGINIPNDCKNISNSSTAKVSLDLSSLSAKTFTVDKFSVSGLSDDYKADVTQNSISVKIIGPKSEIDNLKESKITGVIDTSDSNGTTGSVSMPLSFKIDTTKSCWAYGSYKANLTISEK